MTLTAAASAVAQPPAGGMGAERSAQLLLARSAELGLTDAQVVKLAAIARRAEARRAPMRAAMDSARTRFTQPGDSLARRQFAQRMQTDMTKERDQARVDLRDAIAVLTPDQQAKAWEMNAAREAGGARGGRGGGRGGGMRPGRPGGMGGMGGMGGAMRGGRGGAARPPRGGDPFGPGPMPRGARPDRDMGPDRAARPRRPE